ISEVQRELGLERVYKLASNENPLGLSLKVKEALINALDDLTLYPDASCYNLNLAVSKYYNIASEQLAFGNGSEEVIDLLIRVFCSPGEAILTSSHSFLIYKLSAQAFQVETLETPMKSDLKFNLEAMKTELEKNSDKIRLVFIANPNNPTGTYVNEAELRDFIEFSQRFENTLIVIDEAYNEFVRAKDYPKTETWLNEYKNLVLIRTFSKVFGLAGLRLGIILANPEYISYYHRVRKPFNVNSLAQVAGVAILEDQNYLKESQRINWEGLDYFYKELDKLGLKYWPSQANFVLFETPQSGIEAYKLLLQQGIIMRPVGGYGLTNYLRLSVGKSEENHAAIEALKKIL
ncbi:MAG: histidinol-phosphate transaminase, partial [Bdellovibrionales bacterium]|nr:histidinol-phosphate transaminase [Bdellovibrionales bacterium]